MPWPFYSHLLAVAVGNIPGKLQLLLPLVLSLTVTLHRTLTLRRPIINRSWCGSSGSGSGGGFWCDLGWQTSRDVEHSCLDLTRLPCIPWSSLAAEHARRVDVKIEQAIGLLSAWLRGILKQYSRIELVMYYKINVNQVHTSFISANIFPIYYHETL